MALAPSKPSVYGQGHHESVLRAHSWRTVANSAAYIVPHLKPNFRVLDVGCGPGTITIDIARLVPEGHVTGIEPAEAENVLAGARSLAAEQGVHNVDFAVGDVYALEYPDATFDVVHAHQVLQHVGDPVKALREMRRVAKPGGFIAVREADSSSKICYPYSDEISSYWKLFQDISRANGGEPDAGRRLHVWAKQAGFDPAGISCSSSTWCHYTPEQRAWWGNLWAERILASKFASNAKKYGLADDETLKKHADTWKTWAADDDGWFSLTHGEIIARV